MPMKTLEEQFGKPVLFHWVGWYGKDGYPTKTGYDSRDPNVINNQLEAMLEFGGEHSGVVALTYGLTSDFILQSVMAIANQTCVKNMPFCLCMDPWAVKKYADKNARMITTLDDPQYQLILNMKNYIKRTDGKKWVLDFSTGVSKVAIETEFNDITYMMNGPDFDWIRFPQTPNKTTLPCTYVEFFDGTGKDHNVSISDPTQPCRIVNANAGSTFWGNDVKAGQYFQFVTWNDVTESTSIEQFASVVSSKI